MKKNLTLLISIVLVCAKSTFAQMDELDNNYKAPLDFIDLLLHPDNSQAKMRAKRDVIFQAENSCTNYKPIIFPRYKYNSTTGRMEFTGGDTNVWQLLFTIAPDVLYKYQQQQDTFFCSDSNDIIEKYSLFDAKGRVTFWSNKIDYSNERYSYTYDKKDRIAALIITRWGDYENTNGYNNTEVFTMGYDNKGNLKSLAYSGNYQKIATYNSDLKMISITEYGLGDVDTFYQIRDEYYLNNNNSLKKYVRIDYTRANRYDDDPFYDTLQVEYFYNKNGLLKNTVEENNVYENVKNNAFEYDKHNNPIVYKWNSVFDEMGEIYIIDSMSYIYNNENKIETVSKTRYSKLEYDITTEPDWHSYTLQYYYYPNGLLRKKVDIDDHEEGPTIITSFHFK